MKYAYPIMSHAGLGNLLFPWARAAIYCQQSGAKMLAPDWGGAFRLGPWLRHERCKRYYANNFNTNGMVMGLTRWWLLHFNKHAIRFFSGMGDLFESLLAHQTFLAQSVDKMTRSEIRAEVACLSREQFIAVHIRRGDFTRAGYATDDAWYVRAIKCAVSDSRCRFIRVFSDAYPFQLKFISDALPECRVEIMDDAKPMRDLLLMAKAMILVASSESTFSMWAVFLGQVPSIWSAATLKNPHQLYADVNRQVQIVE